ncbi:hypothetical protein ACLOJK_027035 [Asimina triloba]
MELGGDEWITSNRLLFYNSKLSSPLYGFDPISPLFYTIFRIVVTAIQEAKNLETIKVEELMGSLMTHEVLMHSKDKPSEEPKGRQTMALKVNSDDE